MFKDNPLSYDFQLSWLSIKKTPILSALMVTAIAIGIAAFMTVISLYVIAARDPIPSKSEQIHTYALDNHLGKGEHTNDHQPMLLSSYNDALNIMKSDIPSLQSVHYQTWSIYRNKVQGVKPFWEMIRLSTPGFFSLFDVPFLYGSSWNQQQEDQQARVIVLSKPLNNRLFGGENSLGKKVEVDERFYEVVGVMNEFNMMPKFFEFDSGLFGNVEGAFIPFSLTAALKIMKTGSITCRNVNLDEDFESYLAADCNWLHHWVLLASADERQLYLEYLNNYAMEQRRYGRFQGAFNNRIYNVKEWLEHLGSVPKHLIMLIIIGLLFLIVCLINTNALLFAKFSEKSNDISIKRALGCSKTRLFRQHIIELSLIGLLGGVLGLLLTFAGFSAVVSLLVDNLENPPGINIQLIALTITTAIISTLITGLYPAWRSCQLAPASYLKSQ